MQCLPKIRTVAVCRNSVTSVRSVQSSFPSAEGTQVSLCLMGAHSEQELMESMLPPWEKSRRHLSPCLNIDFVSSPCQSSLMFSSSC